MTDINALKDLRLRLAIYIMPRTHRAIEVGDVFTDARTVHSDLVRGGDALARGWGCDPAILYNGAALIAQGEGGYINEDGPDASTVPITQPEKDAAQKEEKDDDS